MSAQRHAVVVIGAGFCGLAVGTALRARGVDGFDPTVNGGLSLGPWGWEAGERIAAELRTRGNA